MRISTTTQTFSCLTLTLFLLGGTVYSDEITPTMREVWLAVREDGAEGTGTACDPFDAGTPERFHQLFDRFMHEYGDNLVIHFGPGVYLGNRMIRPGNNWKIRGAGMDVTILRTRPDPDAIATVGFRAGGYPGGPVGFELSDMTIDFNSQNLRKANRAFVYHLWESIFAVGYYPLDSAPEWSATETYKGRDYASVVSHKGIEYIAVKTSENEEPSQGEFWSVLHPLEIENYPGWDPESAYSFGDAVSHEGIGYLCTRENTGTVPTDDAKAWWPVNAGAPDPRIYTNGAFVCSAPPDGGHRVSRVKMLNGHGCYFFPHEAFLIGLGGNDCVIEDCHAADFRGDYGTLMTVFYGHNNVIRNCTVRYTQVPTPYALFAYGGWACYDTAFENNYAYGLGSATNIDSLTSRNVTFRNNTFMNCAYSGILVNVNGKPVASCLDVTTMVAGKVTNIAESKMDGLLVMNNLIEVRDDAPNGAVRVQSDGLENVRISGNVLRTVSGEGAVPAIRSFGNVRNIVVTGNTCDPNMTIQLRPEAVCRDNMDSMGRLVPGE